MHVPTHKRTHEFPRPDVFLQLPLTEPIISITFAQVNICKNAHSCPFCLVPAGPGSIHRCSPGGGAWVRAGGVPGVLLNLSFPKCQWDRLEEGGIVILLLPCNGLIRLSAKRLWLLCTDVVSLSLTHSHKPIS